MNVNGRLAKAYYLFKANLINIVLLVFVVFFINSIIGSYVTSILQGASEPSAIIAVIYSFIVAIGSAVITIFTCFVGANHASGKVSFESFVEKFKENKYTIVKLYLLYFLATIATSFLLIILSMVSKGLMSSGGMRPIGFFIVVDIIISVFLYTALFFVFSGNRGFGGTLKYSFSCIKDNVPAIIGIVIILYFITQIRLGSIQYISGIGDTDVTEFFSGSILRIAHIFIYLFLFQYYISWSQKDKQL